MCLFLFFMFYCVIFYVLLCYFYFLCFIVLFLFFYVFIFILHLENRYSNYLQISQPDLGDIDKASDL